MKTPEEIRNDILIKGHRYASTKCRIKSQATFNKYEKILGHFVDGYEQCKTDMADKKYTELQLRFFANELIKGVEEKNKQGYEDIKVDYESLILSLNKQN